MSYILSKNDRYANPARVGPQGQLSSVFNRKGGQESSNPDCKLAFLIFYKEKQINEKVNNRPQGLKPN